MPKIPGINQRAAVAALEKAGFVVLRQGGHIIMSNGIRALTIPRHNPINAYTMGNIAKASWFSRRTNFGSCFDCALFLISAPCTDWSRPS